MVLRAWLVCCWIGWVPHKPWPSMHEWCTVLCTVCQTPRRLTLPLSYTLPPVRCLSLCHPPCAPPASQLVKPAHLLPKTYGFEQFGSEEPLPPEAVEPEPYHASTDREQLGDDVFGGYRRSGRY